MGVVICTHDRPVLMREALATVLEQSYPGMIDVVVVFDRSEPETELELETPTRRVRVTTNLRTPGLAGARNSGIALLDTEWTAFCDDDDTWRPERLERQVSRLEGHPDAVMCTTAMTVRWGDQTTDRLAGKDEVTFADLLRSRMAMLHSSSFLLRTDTLSEGGAVGPVDETLPRSMAEDWDLMLRASRVHPIVHVDEPLVDVLWGATSYFNDAWRDKNEAHHWLLEHYPEMLDDPVAHAFMSGKLAFGHAALGERRTALAHTRECLAARWREPRGWLALAVIAGVPASRVQSALNKRGRGI